MGPLPPLVPFGPIGPFGPKIKLKIPWWLAGGVSAEWVPEVLAKINPYGLDASSRLEISPGLKDIKKVRSLIEAIKNFQRK